MPTRIWDKDGLRVDVRRTADGAFVVLSGATDARDPGLAMTEVLRILTADTSAAFITIDLRELEYLNSGSVAPLIHLVRNLDARGTSTEVLYDTTRDWQRLNFQCMRAIARTLERVRVRSS